MNMIILFKLKTLCGFMDMSMTVKVCSFFDAYGLFLFYSSFLKLLDLSQRGMDKWWIDNDARYKDLFHKDESSYDFIFGRHLRVGSIPVRMFQKLISVWKAHQYNYNFVRTTKSPKPCDHWVSHRKWKCVWYWQYCRPLQICNVVVPCLLSDLSGHSCRW
jgi:hypothetical protein